MTVWKFICWDDTERECLLRLLFGDGAYHDIRRGDICLLHNTQSDILYGPFIALTDCTHLLVPQAWTDLRQPRRFVWQVAVRPCNPTYMLMNASGQINILRDHFQEGNDAENIYRQLLANPNKKRIFF